MYGKNWLVVLPAENIFSQLLAIINNYRTTAVAPSFSDTTAALHLLLTVLLTQIAINIQHSLYAFT